jgi:hypothetical protein
MPASSIPGYIMGHRFSDDAAHYNSTTKRFLDKAGYGAKADLRVTVGDPTFATVNSQRAVLMDNTCHGNFHSPIAWQGSAVFVLKPNYVSGATLTRYPIQFGDFASAASNGKLIVLHSSGQRIVRLGSPSDQLTGSLQRADNNAVVVAFAISQETRLMYRSIDGVTVSTSTATASTVNGNAVALGSAQYGSRWGNMSGTAGDTTPITDMNCYFMEQHFFSENILTGSNLALTAAFIAELKAQYGAS